MKWFFTRFLPSAFLLLMIMSSQAATKYWDTNGVTAGAGGATPAGTWNTAAAANWTTDSTGASAATTWAANDDAVFSAGSDATGSFTITIPSGTTNAANSVTVEEGTILMGPGTLTFGSVNGIFDVANGATWNISGAGSGLVTGTGGITKTGAGTLFLGGSEQYTNASSSTAALLAINAGIVDFTGDTALGATQALARAAAVTINGGTLRYSATTALTLNINRGVTIGASGGTIEVSSAASTGLSLPSSAPFTLNGSGLMTKTGPGRLTLNTTANSFTGKYKILGGSISSPGDGRFGQVPASTVADYFVLDGSDAGLRNSLTTAVSFDAKRGITLGAGGGTLIQPTAGPLTIAAIIAGASGGTLRIANNDGFSTFTGGIVILSGANTYDGPTTVAASTTLRLGASGVIPDTSLINPLGAAAVFDLNGFDETIKTISGTAGTIAIGAKTLTLNNPVNETYSSVISGAGKLVKNGTGTNILSGSSTGWSGETVVNSGVLGIGGANAAGAGAILTMNGGKLCNTSATGRALPVTLVISNSFSLDDTLFTGPGQISVTNIIIKSSNPTFTVNAASSYIFPAVVGGVWGQDVAGRGWTKAGNGQVTLNNENTYTGNTTISAGTISINGSVVTPFGQGGAIIMNGGNIIVSADRGTSGNNLTNAMQLTANSQLQSAGTTGTRNLVFGGAWTTTAGTLTLHETGTSAGPATFNVRFTNTFTFSQPITFLADNAGHSINLDVWNRSDLGDQTYSGLISGPGSIKRSITTANTGGKVTFTAQNTYSGGTSLNDGEIGLGSDCTGAADAPTAGPLGTGTVTLANDAGKLSASGGSRNLFNHIAFTVGGTHLTFVGANDLELSGNVDLAGLSNTITNNNTGLAKISGVISNGSLTKQGVGTLTLSGANTYTGDTTISQGTLALTVGGALASVNVNVATDAALDVSAAPLTLGNNQTLKGNGSVTGVVSVAIGSAIAPGASIGTLTNVGATKLLGGGNDVFEINNAVGGPSAGWDLLAVTGGIDVQATSSNKFIVRLTSLNGAVPGNIANFSAADTSYTWPFATVTDTITNFDASAFTVNSSAFSNSLAGGHFSVAVDNVTNLAVVFSTNVPPVATNDFVARPAGLTVKIPIATLLTNDSDADAAFGDSISFVGVSATSTNGGSVSNSASLVFYVPANSVNDAFTYTIQDAFGHQATGTVLVSLTPQTVSTNTVVSLDVGVPGPNTNTLSFAGIPGYEYSVQFSTNLVDWEDFTTNTAGANGLWQVIDDTATNALRFYRTVHR